MSIKSQHTCVVSCDACDGVIYEGPLDVDSTGQVKEPRTDWIRVSFLHQKERKSFMLCEACNAATRDKLLAALPPLPFEDDRVGTLQIELWPVEAER